nr:MAG TPA: hypothetical protein [Caudoviricetes sp.]
MPHIEIAASISFSEGQYHLSFSIEVLNMLPIG